jgi:hypothetical protein
MEFLILKNYKTKITKKKEEANFQFSKKKLKLKLLMVVSYWEEH